MVVPQPPFPPRAVASFDAHRGVEREAAAVLPAGPVERVGGVKGAVADEPTQHARAQLLLHGGDIVNAQCRHLGEADLPVLGGGQHAVDKPIRL